MTIDQEREELRRALQATRFNTAAIFAHESEAPPLDMKILHKRRVNTDYYNYEEWKIEYTVETQESIPIPAGQRVSAYLLVPWRQAVKAPFPAMICFHQCNVDCPLGKESVVGKVSYRPDQAYGLELVTEGFVVLAPDSINCGERFIPAIRSEGEGKQCRDIIGGALGRHKWSKHHLDDIRAVDLLCSLEFVDFERIGVIGHSMGSIDARDVMIYDSRVKACILSCSLQPNDFIPLHSPRLHIALQGSLDGTSEYFERIRASYEHARRFYEADGVPENLILRIHDCGHHFLDEFRWEAYSKLKLYFGMDERKAVSLAHVLKRVREECRACRELEAFPDAPILECIRVIANEGRLRLAFCALSVYLVAKSGGNPLVLELKESRSTISATYGIRSDTPKEVAATRMHHENYLRHAHQLFVGAGASMQEKVTPDALEYSVKLSKAR